MAYRSWRVAALVVALVGVLAAAVWFVPLRAGSDEAEGRIVFYSDGGYVAFDLASAQVSRLTAQARSVTRGELSPDGASTVAACDPATLEASAQVVDNRGACRTDVTTGSRVLLFDAGFPVQHPTLSPDGSQIVFASGADADHGLKVAGSDGGEIRSLCDGFCPLFRFFDIAWSPDGSQVAFVATTPGSAGHSPQIYVVTVGKSDYRQLTDSAGSEFDPAWSPDGRHLAFTSTRTGDTEVFVMAADGTGQTRLTYRDGLDIDPSWSPNGRDLVFARRVGISWDLAIIDAGGGAAATLVDWPGPEMAPVWVP